MKKVCTLFMALSFVVSMMAVPNRIASPFAPKGKVQVEAGQNKNQVKKPVRKVVMESSTTFSFASVADTSQVEDDIKLVLAKGGGQNDPAWNTTDAHLRVYANNTLTISAEGITNIEITWTKGKSSKDYADLSVNVGDLTSGGTSTGTTDEKTDTWEGEADKVVFTLGAGQRAIKEVVVTVGGEPIVPKDTLYATVNNAGFELDDTYFYWFGEIYGYVYGGDTLTDYFEADFAFEEEIEDLAGSYTQKDMSDYYVIYQGKEIDVKKISLTVNPAEGLNRTAKAEVLGKDTILYIYDINYIVPDKANDTVYVNFDQNASISRYADGDYYFYVEKTDTIFTLDVYTDKVVGEYTTDDIDTYYSYLVSMANKDTVYTQYYTLNTKIEEQAGVYKVTAEMLAYDTVLYIINFSTPVPAAARTENLTMVGEFEMDDDYGMWYAEGATSDNQYMFAAYTYADQAVGSWDWTDLYGMQVINIVAPGDTATYDVYDFQSLTTEMNATNDSIVVAASFLGQDEANFVQFNITMTCPYTGSEGGDTVYITSMDGVEAYYYYEKGDDYAGNFWDFYFYTDSEDDTPSMYWMGYDYAESGTAIAGEYEGTAWAHYVAEAGDTVGVSDEYYEDAYMTITYNSTSKNYTFKGEWIGDDGKTYIFDITTSVMAYDEDGDEITLNEGGTPTPTGDTITVAQAEAIAGALGDNETTEKTYTIIAYAGTTYNDGSFWIVDNAGGKSNFQIYKPTVDKTVTKGDYVKAVGKLKKYVAKSGSTILEMTNATVTHIDITALDEIRTNDSMQKVMINGQLYIIKNGMLYNAQGQMIER